MTDAEFEQFKARMQTIVDVWRECLGLGWWHVTLHSHRDSAAFHEASPEEMPLKSQAYTSVSWAYLHAEVHFNLPLLLQADDSALEEVVVHEFMHILVHEMRSGTRCDCPYDIRHEERVCTTLQRAFAWTKEHFLRAAHENEAPTPAEETVPDAG